MAGGSDKDNAGSSEYTSEAEEVGQQASLYGNLRTRLRWQPSSKTMNLDVRQTLQSRRNMEFRFKARLDTNSGAYTHVAQLQRNMHQNTPSMARVLAAERGIRLDGEASINPDRFLPGGVRTLLFRDFTLSPGVRFTGTGAAAAPAAPAAAADISSSSSSSSRNNSFKPKYFVTLRKQPQVLHRQGVWDSWVAGKADFELDAQQQQVQVRGSLRLKAFRFNVTDKQDLQMALGCDYTMGVSKGRTATPYLKVGENSWSVKLQNQQWSFNCEI